MVSLEDSRSIPSRFPLPLITPRSTRIHRNVGRSMRTIRSNHFNNKNDDDDQHKYSFTSTQQDDIVSEAENLTDSVVDMRLNELATTSNQSSYTEQDFLELSNAFSDLSSCSSDVSGELQRLACLPSPVKTKNDDVEGVEQEEEEPCVGFLQRESFSSGIIERISPEDLQPTVKICVDGLSSNSVAGKRSSAAKLRLLAKNRADNRALIGECGAIPALIPLLRCSDALTQEHAVTALLNLSLHEDNKGLIIKAGGVKSLVYVLKTGTESAKQNGACALLSLAFAEENKGSIGACGAIPPLVGLLMNGTSRGKKDALTTLYKLCSDKQNKKRAVSAGVVKPLVGLVNKQGTGMAEKAMVVLNCLTEIQKGKDAIVEEGGIGALVDAIEDGTVKGKEFALLTLLQLCSNSEKNRGLLVREGGIPPLVALSETGSVRAKHKAEKLLKYLRETRRKDPSSSSS